VQEVADVLARPDKLGASRDRVTVDDIQACPGARRLRPGPDILRADDRGGLVILTLAG